MYVELLFAGSIKGDMVQITSCRKYFVHSSAVGICES